MASTATKEPGRRRIGDTRGSASKRLLPEDARSHNRALVLRLLYRGEGQSRAELARASGLSQVTVSDLVTDLIDEGIVIEGGRRKGPGPGAPARVLGLAPNSRNVIAVAISGGDRFEGVVFTLGGEVIARDVVERSDEVGEAALLLLTDLVDRLVTQVTAPVLGIGVSSPGIIDADGVVRVAANLGWTDVPLQELLAERTGLPVYVTNGANALGIAELSLGQVDHDLLLVRVGSGVGVAAIINGALVHGRNFAAGELGHVIVSEGEGPVCGCGRVGCLEAWLAAPRLEARLAAAEQPEEGDLIRRQAGRYLGAALAPLVVTLGLTDIALSGPPELIEGALIEGVRDTLRTRILPILFQDLEVHLAEPGDDTRLRGAMILVLAEVLGIT